jgi:hypothetical protein
MTEPPTVTDLTGERQTAVRCPVCGAWTHWLPDLNRTVARVGCHGPTDSVDCAGSFARVTRPDPLDQTGTDT